MLARFPLQTYNIDRANPDYVSRVFNRPSSCVNSRCSRRAFNSWGRDLCKSPSAAPAQGKTQNQESTARLIKVYLYYEVPQNALCSLCLHCLNSGSKKPQEGLSRPPEVRCVRYRLHSSKNAPVQRVRYKPLQYSL